MLLSSVASCSCLQAPEYITIIALSQGFCESLYHRFAVDMTKLITAYFLASCILLSLGIAHAGGFLCGKVPSGVWASDQVTVLTLGPTGVTVDMHLTLVGLRKGETVSYVLPFWYEPRGFTLDEEDVQAFQDRYVEGAYEHLQADTQHDAAVREAITRHFALTGIGAFGLPMLAPAAILEPVTARHKTEDMPHSVSLPAPPAHAVSFMLKQADLQAYLGTVELSPGARQALRNYHTPYYAVVKIGGIGGRRSWDQPYPRGVHLHFHHLLKGYANYRYTFPLGAGSAWKKPILLNECYITCPPEEYLTVSAPVIGHAEDQLFLNEVLKHSLDQGDEELRDIEQARWKTRLAARSEHGADHRIARAAAHALSIHLAPRLLSVPAH